MLYTSSLHHLHLTGSSVSMVWPRSRRRSLNSSLSFRWYTLGSSTISVSSSMKLSSPSCTLASSSSDIVMVSMEISASDSMKGFFFLFLKYFFISSTSFFEGLYFLFDRHTCFFIRSNFFLQNLQVSFFLCPLGGLATGIFFLHTSLWVFSLSDRNSFLQKRKKNDRHTWGSNSCFLG